MELKGEVTIAAARPRVWAALNDPAVLARCIDGVESLTRVDGPDGERLEGKMNAKIGPVRATFAGAVTLTEVVAPERYVLVGEGKGGVAGFAKGQAAVSLAEVAPGETLLRYDVSSSVGGKIAQLGARLIEGTAKAYAETFFGRLKAELESPLADGVADADAMTATQSPAVAVAAATDAPPAVATGLSPLIWGGLLVAGVLVFLVWQWG